MEREKAKQEVLRYLGHRGQALPPELDAMIDGAMSELAGIRPRYIWRIFSLAGEPLRLAGAPLGQGGSWPGGGGAGAGGVSPVVRQTRECQSGGLELAGGDIANHLAGCRQAALLAATLGVEADNLIRRAEFTDLTRSLVLDACATQRIEEACDAAQGELRLAVGEKQALTTRFSPGYGDLPLTIQPGVLELLDAGRRIGLTCTGSLILLPRKSVTALVGILPAGEGGRDGRSCENCPMGDRCPYRRRQGRCGTDFDPGG